MLNVGNIVKSINGEPLYSEVNFQVYAGEKVGLVGSNGAGKTTLFRMITGEIRPDEGSISLESNARMAYFSQSVGEMKGKTALEEVMEGNARLAAVTKELHIIEKKLESPLSDDEMNQCLERMGDLQSEFEKMGGYELESNAKEILTGLGIPPVDHSKMIEDFSGGWKMRVALAKVLILLPDLILMDEPTNYLDMETILWLEDWLKRFKGAILLTTHDRVFMNNIVKKIVEISGGKATVFSGNYDFYLKEKEIRRKQNIAEFDRQQSMLKKEEVFIARFQARASHAAQVQSRVKKLEKIERVEIEADEQEMRIELPTIDRGSNDVVVMKDLGKEFPLTTGEKKLVFNHLSATVFRQNKIAVVGVNGAGKSTLLNIICQNFPPTYGSVTLGPSIKFGYFGQHPLNVLSAEDTVFDTLKSAMPSAHDGIIRSILASFLFQGDDVFKKIKFLSGGEKARVVLARILSLPNNLLVLDEPTNHLDIRSRTVLLEALKRYEGTLLLVSHDRYFLNELTDRVFEVDRGHINIYEGGFREYSQRDKIKMP